MKKLKYHPLPKHCIRTSHIDWREVAIIFAAIVCIILVYGWMQKDDEAHKVLDKSYAEETRKDMAKQSEAAKRQAKWDELNAEAKRMTSYERIK